MQSQLKGYCANCTNSSYLVCAWKA